MKRDLALRVLGEIMGWDDARAIEEFRWLSLISRLKYDGYQDFLAGVRFIESLATWIQQFETPAERTIAYQFVRQVLVYVGPAEMQRLIELLYPDCVQRRLVRIVAEAAGVPTYRVWADSTTATAYDSLLRRTLFIGLSEGAHLDLFRRANAGLISNEQVLLAAYADREKWRKLLEDLRDALKESTATFRIIYLIDDFTGSGTTLLRKRPEGGRGKLATFRASIDDVLATHFDAALTVCVHHYMATDVASVELEKRQAEALAELGPVAWFSDVAFSFGTLLPPTIPIDRSTLRAAKDFIVLAVKYCDREELLKNRHFDEGPTKDPAFGFADGALPLVLEHNTPNNSVALLWAETEGDKGALPSRHSMRPLFRRRQRHV